MQPLSIAICGCGPAGLAAALVLGRLGHRIVLIERFDEPRPLGSGLLLQPGGLRVLEALGLGPGVGKLGVPIRRLLGITVPSGRTALDVRYGSIAPDAHALGIHRAALFGTLFEAVKATSADIETRFEVAGIDPAANGRPVVVGASGRRLGPFDLAIDALGSRSVIAEGLFGPRLHRPLAWGALWATVPWPATGFDGDTLEQRYVRARRMIGVLPTGRRGPEGAPEAAFFWSLKAAEFDRWRMAGLAAWKAEVRTIWPETEPLLAALADPGQLTFADYGQHTLALPIANRIAIIGDAAHATSPQLGQGANMGLLDAAALGEAFAGGSDPDTALLNYARSRRWHIRLYQMLGAVATPFYQSDSVLLPALRDRGFATLSALPGGRRQLAALVAGLWLNRRPTRRRNRSTPLTYLSD